MLFAGVHPGPADLARLESVGELTPSKPRMRQSVQKLAQTCAVVRGCTGAISALEQCTHAQVYWSESRQSAAADSSRTTPTASPPESQKRSVGFKVRRGNAAAQRMPSLTGLFLCPTSCILVAVVYADSESHHDHSPILVIECVWWLCPAQLAQVVRVRFCLDPLHPRHGSMTAMT